MVKNRFCALFVTVAVAVILTAGCQKTDAPDTPSIPSGPTSGGIAATYDFSSSAIDPDGDSVAIRFDWGDGDTSDWSAYMPSGETATASHSWADTGAYQVRAQARNKQDARSHWSDGLQVEVAPGWFRAYGGQADDYCLSVQQTSDGGYVMTGTTKSYGEGQADVYLVRVSSAGDTLWTRTFGGTSDDVGYSVRQTSDGGYIIVGGSSSFGSGSQVFLVKTDSSGDHEWDRLYGYADHDEYGASVQQTSDGGYIMAGRTSDNSGDVFIVKTDGLGNTVWYDSKGYDNSNEDAASVQQTSDGGYILVGTTFQHDAQGDVWLVKIGADGGTGWYNHFGGAAADLGKSVRQTTDGGYIIAGVTASYGAGSADVYLVKTDAGGNQLWLKTFGGAEGDGGWSVQQTTDGGYIIAGYTISYGAGSGDVYLMKTDGDGNQQWYRTLGGSAPDEGFSVQQTADGGYVIAGATESYGAGGLDFYLIKTDSDGNCLP